MTSSSFGVIFFDQVGTKALLLLHAASKEFFMTDIEKLSTDVCKVEVPDSGSCFSASTKLQEYPNHEQNKVQHQSICVAAKHF